MANKYWKLLGHYAGVAQAFEAAAGTLQTSPVSPDADGRLKGLRVVVSGQAATSLTETVQIRLTCSLWTPNTIHVGGSGQGLLTVPQSQPAQFDWEVDQPVKTGSPITVEGRHGVATAVTPAVTIWGLFEAS
jgi:hypothetical protein